MERSEIRDRLCRPASAAPGFAALTRATGSGLSLALLSGLFRRGLPGLCGWLALCRRLARRRLGRLPGRLAENRLPIVAIGLRHGLLAFAAAVVGGGCATRRAAVALGRACGSLAFRAGVGFGSLFRHDVS